MLAVCKHVAPTVGHVGARKGDQTARSPKRFECVVRVHQLKPGVHHTNPQAVALKTKGVEGSEVQLFHGLPAVAVGRGWQQIFGSPRLMD